VATPKKQKSAKPTSSTAVDYSHEDEAATRERIDTQLRQAGWLKDNLNLVPALIVVAQRPRELTRAQLKEIKLALDEAGYSEINLHTAWREWKNQDIAATIVGHIRNRALGSPLLPYVERVEHALQAILSSHAWTAPQRQWLQRIANQIKAETVVDRDAFDHGVFASNGGFTRLNKTFEGQLQAVIADFHDRIWQDAAP
jgi:type I restriction enzyme R subunit